MIALLDSSVWVSYFNDFDTYHARAVAIVEEFIGTQTIIVVPDVVLAEVTNVLIRLDPTDVLIERFHQHRAHFDWLVESVFGNREFWTKTIEEVAHKVQLKTLDLIIVSYAYHFQVDLFRSFDTQQEKAAQKILKR
ncbi:MAG: PIN domain-containing protein [Bacteroidota bacterium]|jgi:predicted nucleic acid-binding protein